MLIFQGHLYSYCYKLSAAIFYINRDIIILVLICRHFLREDNFHVGIINSQIRLNGLNTKMLGIKEKWVVKTQMSISRSVL